LATPASIFYRACFQLNFYRFPFASLIKNNFLFIA